MKEKNVTTGYDKHKGTTAPLEASYVPALGVSTDETKPFAEILERNAQGLWRFLLVRVGGDKHLAEDLMQELCLQAARSHNKNRAEHVDAWLFGVARNVLRRHWRTITRRRNNLPEVHMDVSAELAEKLDAGPLPNDYLERREVKEQVLLALTSLPADDQNLILWHYFDGQSQTDIAISMGISARAVEGRLYRARTALRDRLKHMENELY